MQIKRLVIVESPAKARTISQFLGAEYLVESSIGHIRDLPSSAAQIPKKYNVTIRSSTNIDEDFLYLCSAKNLLLSSNGSGFGKCAQYINQLIKTGKYLPVPRKNRRNPKFGMKLL